jgi:hypothetical protein
MNLDTGEIGDARRKIAAIIGQAQILDKQAVERLRQAVYQ